MAKERPLRQHGRDAPSGIRATRRKVGFGRRAPQVALWEMRHGLSALPTRLPRWPFRANVRVADDPTQRPAAAHDRAEARPAPEIRVSEEFLCPRLARSAAILAVMPTKLLIGRFCFERLEQLPTFIVEGFHRVTLRRTPTCQRLTTLKWCDGLSRCDCLDFSPGPAIPGCSGSASEAATCLSQNGQKPAIFRPSIAPARSTQPG
jgi:hypothetical protein